ncbi:two-component sensor histidine kinase [Oxalobacteraceae bacterium]|nr:two-component sensor histidine kinase [Oxalobacteraceae bacterium]
MLGLALDRALYPTLALEFALARLLVCVLIFGLIVLMRCDAGKRHIQWLTFTWLLLPQLMIAWMISVTDGATSIYYVGLTLAIYSSGIVLAFGLWQNIVFGSITYLLYAAACAVHPAGIELRGVFVVNSLFLLMSAAVGAVFTFYNERARYMLYRLKTEVAQKNRQLEITNKDLSDIKGQMLQQEKMAALGTLSAGLLHEVNNPVNFCLMAIDIAAEEPVARASPLLSECLADARQGMLRVQHIVSDLKTFAYRKDGSDFLSAQFLFEHALGSAIRLVGHEMKGVDVKRELPFDTMVRGDEAAIIGVLINLFSNAIAAMRKAGRSPPALVVAAKWQQDRLHVAVRDNGPGIAPEHLARVFEPFFTTRAVGQGLGLGLSISYSVIERHGGLLTADSVVGEWTTMMFDLPRAATELI